MRALLSSRKFHRSIGLLMLLPMIGWSLTGLVFFIKPGYEDAYEIPAIKTYPLEQAFSIEPDLDWRDVRLVRTVLGDHLLVKTSAVSKHLDPQTLEEKPLPAPGQIELLLEEVISGNPQRYGSITSINRNKAITTTGVTLELDWNRLTLKQRGKDTEFIDLLYQVHYLQWTPWSSFNQVLGMVGLFFLVVLSALGVNIYLASRPRKR